MRISKDKLNEAYKLFCKNRELDILDEQSTKDFMKYYMEKRNLTHVKQDGEVFHFLKLSRK